MLRDITADDTKYYYVVALLSRSTASQVVTLLNEPPERDKYDTLKTYLLGNLGLTELRAGQLLLLPGLGKAKPSKLMDHMLTILFGDHNFQFSTTNLSNSSESSCEFLKMLAEFSDNSVNFLHGNKETWCGTSYLYYRSACVCSHSLS